MSVSRLEHITKIGVEDMGALADGLGDPDLLRLENLDTDLRPPEEALAATRAAVDDDDANSYLPFLGLDVTRRAAAAHVGRQAGIDYDWRTQSLISAGGLSGVLNVLLALLEPGDEVLMTDPIYVGLINRVRLAGGVPPLRAADPDAGGLASRHRGAGEDRSETGQSRAPDESGDADRRRLHARRVGEPGRLLPARRVLADRQHGDGGGSSSTTAPSSTRRRFPRWPSGW